MHARIQRGSAEESTTSWIIRIRPSGFRVNTGFRMTGQSDDVDTTSAVSHAAFEGLSVQQQSYTTAVLVRVGGGSRQAVLLHSRRAVMPYSRIAA